MTLSQPPIRLYRDFVAGQSALARAREAVRNVAVTVLSLGRSPDQAKGWIRFPYYHHVFDDERDGFARHLDFMSSHGDLIGIDDAVRMLGSGDTIDGRYFCITFDDGFKNWITNAVPILVDHGAAAAFFVITRYIGTSSEVDRDALLKFYDEGNRLMEFLDWEDCRRMTDAGMTIGSHTVNHVHMANLDEAAAEAELRQSKETIEAELGITCDHFCCPFGRENVDYLPDRDPEIARRVGYKSFLSGHRGAMRQGGSPMMIRRDHLLANWGNAQLRYFFSS